MAAYQLEPPVTAGWSAQKHCIERVRSQLFYGLIRFLHAEVYQQHAIHPGRRRVFSKTLESVVKKRVEVTKQQQRDIGFASYLAHHVQNAVKRGSRAQRTFRSSL